MTSLKAQARGESDPKPSPQKLYQQGYAAKPGDFAVICTVFNAEPAGSPRGHPQEPRFIITARVEEVASGKSPWKAGKFVRFTVHSPALLFRGNDYSGQRFLLTFSPFRPDGKDDEVGLKPETRYILKWVAKASKNGGG